MFLNRRAGEEFPRGKELRLMRQELPGA